MNHILHQALVTGAAGFAIGRLGSHGVVAEIVRLIDDDEVVVGRQV